MEGAYDIIMINLIVIILIYSTVRDYAVVLNIDSAGEAATR